MLAGVVRQYPTYSNAWANLRAFTGGCGLADDVLVEPDPNDGFLQALPGNYGPLGPLGGVGPVGFTPNGVPEHIVAETIRMTLPQPGTDYDWDCAERSWTAPGVNGSTVPLPYGLDPARVPVAGSYVEGAQQQSRLTSAWYELPPPRRRASAGGGHRRGHDHRQQRVERAHRRADRRAGVRAARTRRRRWCRRAGWCPYDLGPTPSWRNLRFARAQIPADAVAVRVVAEDLSLTPGDWVAVTPPRVPELRSVQEYVGS